MAVVGKSISGRNGKIWDMVSAGFGLSCSGLIPMESFIIGDREDYRPSIKEKGESFFIRNHQLQDHLVIEDRWKLTINGLWPFWF
jgi:hypothetical protein